MKIMVINGVNMNMLGTREKDVYGENTLEDLYAYIKKLWNGLFNPNASKVAPTPRIFTRQTASRRQSELRITKDLRTILEKLSMIARFC